MCLLCVSASRFHSKCRGSMHRLSNALADLFVSVFPVLQTTTNPAYNVNRNSSISKPLATPSETGSSDAEPGCTNCGCDSDPRPETASLAAEAVAAAGIRHMTWQAWLSPIFIWAGICVHAILEGLALGLQQDKAGTVTVLVAMVSHKWVESVALSSILVKKGGGFKWAPSASIGIARSVALLKTP